MDPFTVHQRRLLQLHRPLEARGRLVPSPHAQEVVLRFERLRHLRHDLGGLQGLRHIVRKELQRLDDLLATGLRLETVLADDQRKHQQRDHFAGVGLRAADGHLVPRVQVHSAVGVGGHGAAHFVGEADAQRLLGLAELQQVQNLRVLARETDEATDVIAEDWWRPIREVRGELDADGQVNKLLEGISNRKRPVVGTAHGKNDDAPRARDNVLVLVDAAKLHRAVLEIQAPAHRVPQALGLLGDLLQHEMRVIPFH
mmetsp:Transcript_11558/g.21200  ORF Transcript_11558/g.21200 Transcript_11558/m.21200 type:complete len:256 (-) Transcript_11558:898-1665(-)